jgi:hypothetical protein
MRGVSSHPAGKPSPAVKRSASASEIFKVVVASTIKFQAASLS